MFASTFDCVTPTSIYRPFWFESKTGSQNCYGWKGPLEIIYSKPPPRQEHLGQIAQERVQVGFECL